MTQDDTDLAIAHRVNVPDAVYLADLATLPQKVDDALLKLEEPGATVDEVCMAVMRIEALKEWIREREATFKVAAKAWVEQHGAFEFGTKRYFVGTEKKEQVRDHERALEVFLSEADIKQLADLMSANAWKAGAVKKFLKQIGKPELFDKLFETTVKTNLKTEKTVRELQVIDTKFLPRD